MNFGFKCICSKKCLPCPKNYYSEGSKNAECVECPEFAHTASNIDLFDSVKKCGKISGASFVKEALNTTLIQNQYERLANNRLPAVLTAALWLLTGKSPKDMNTGYSNHIEHSNVYPGGCYRCNRGNSSRYCFNKRCPLQDGMFRRA